jgi:hypothetical protein
MKTCISSKLLLLFVSFVTYTGYEIINITSNFSFVDIFTPFENSNVGFYGDSNNIGETRVYEGNLLNPSPDLIFGTDSPVIACPQMIGPFPNGSYYCVSKENGILIEYSLFLYLLLLV